jgi:hypothetical protein
VHRSAGRSRCWHDRYGRWRPSGFTPAFRAPVAYECRRSCFSPCQAVTSRWGHWLALWLARAPVPDGSPAEFFAASGDQQIQRAHLSFSAGQPAYAVDAQSDSFASSQSLFGFRAEVHGLAGGRRRAPSPTSLRISKRCSYSGSPRVRRRRRHSWVRIRGVSRGRLEMVWSNRFESHCETSKFSICPTGGQVVAGSNPVSPTL